MSADREYYRAQFSVGGYHYGAEKLWTAIIQPAGRRPPKKFWQFHTLAPNA